MITAAQVREIKANKTPDSYLLIDIENSISMRARKGAKNCTVNMPEYYDDQDIVNLVGYLTELGFSVTRYTRMLDVKW